MTAFAQELAETRALYERLADLKSRLAELRTVEDARIAYEAATAEEARALAAVNRDRDALRLEQRRRRLTSVKPAPATLPPSGAAPAAPMPHPPSNPVLEPPRRAQTSDRRKLKKLVSRWQVPWAIDAALLAQLNGIADDASRPLGEALALLEWRVFETPITGESPHDHEARIREWHQVLHAYADHLQAEIEKVEMRYRNLLAIWARWRDARTSDQGRAEWQRFLDSTREQKRSEIALVEREVAALREALGS